MSDAPDELTQTTRDPCTEKGHYWVVVELYDDGDAGGLRCARCGRFLHLSPPLVENGPDLQLEAYRVAFDEAVRKLGWIERSSDSLRNRAATLATTATAIGAFVGGLAFDRRPIDGQWIAAGAAGVFYALALWCAMVALMPKYDEWSVGLNTEKLANAVETKGVLVAEVYARLAREYMRDFVADNAMLNKMAQYVIASSIFVALELTSLLWLLILTAGNPTPT